VRPSRRLPLHVASGRDRRGRRTPDLRCAYECTRAAAGDLPPDHLPSRLSIPRPRCCDRRRASAPRVESVAIETARFQGDRFDDVIATQANGSVRIQVKHSASRVVLEEDRFDGGDDRLRIADLVRGWEFDPDPLTALRVVATWASPTPEASAGFLVAAEAEPLTPTLRSTRWHLDATGIWPDGGTPRWELLRDLSRASFLNFCERFTLELDAPAMSGSVGEPGPLERVLLGVLVLPSGGARVASRASAGTAAVSRPTTTRSTPTAVSSSAAWRTTTAPHVCDGRKRTGRCC
jgi:hypothetical protein